MILSIGAMVASLEISISITALYISKKIRRQKMPLLESILSVIFKCFSQIFSILDCGGYISTLTSFPVTDCGYITETMCFKSFRI